MNYRVAWDFFCNDPDFFHTPARMAKSYREYQKKKWKVENAKTQENSKEVKNQLKKTRRQRKKSKSPIVGYAQIQQKNKIQLR